jgi:hypothetical protein
MGTREPAAIYLVKITTFAACGGRMAEQANQKLQALVALWEGRRTGDQLPARADLPVSVLRPWLGSLALFELRPEPAPSSAFAERVCIPALAGK